MEFVWSHVHVRLRHKPFRVGIEGHQVAEAGLVGHEDTIVQCDEVVGLVVRHHEAHKAVVNGDMAVNDFLAM